MSIFYSQEQKMTVSIDHYKGDESGKPRRNIYSKWSTALDISNIICKTSFVVAEVNSSRQYEFCYDVNNAPDVFHRTRIVHIYSRFHIVNLSKSELYVSQEGCSDEITFAPRKFSVPFHWEDSSSPPSIKLSTNCVNWSVGSICLNKVGITSIKLQDTSQKSPVFQVEVRLASKGHNAAFVILVWDAENNPVYILKNASPYRIECFQKCQEERNEKGNAVGDGRNFALSTFGCGLSSELLDVSDFISDVPCSLATQNQFNKEYSTSWLLEEGDKKEFGYDYPQRSHVLEWRALGVGMQHIEKIDVDKIGSFCVSELPDGRKIGCVVKVENSSKVIEFASFNISGDEVVRKLQRKLQRNLALSKQLDDNHQDVMAVALQLSFSCELPTLTMSVIDSRQDSQAWRELFLVSIEHATLQISKNTHHDEIEVKITELQVDNFLPKAAHEVLISCLRSEGQPILHFSAIRKFDENATSHVFRYVAVRLLDVTVMLDRR
jgi:hypothetical protein